ncbi:response regulator transcription factor [Cyanobium sp. NIES-981]|uniref:response regulator transcription factor n=1 Tax=Cyanobium sp. NIES-981 TaxID=1851505 RepID=UPI0007DCEC1B|nr:response regulator transcription factor [Cyanobium sp. NIES-981]SBO43396.1 Response regulator containing a CheY-like receiver domain and an HTH DNA-binding domain [Cyanobium sp. NIES-981]
MDLTPFLATTDKGTHEEGLEAIAIPGRVALAAKGRFLLRALCRSFGGYTRITCAVTDQEACLEYLAQDAGDSYQLLVCTDYLESGNGFDLVREARQLRPHLHAVVLALGDAIPAECIEAPWLEAVVAEADFVDDQQPLQAAVMAVLGGHSYRSPSLRTGTLPHLSCPRLTPREYEVLDLLASGLSDRDIARRLVVSDETAHTYTKWLLQTLQVHNRLQAVLKGMRCGMVQI